MAEQKYIQAVYEGRASYLNVFEPHAMSEGDPPMYSLCLIIPKSDKETITRLYKAVEAAKEIGKKQLWGGVIPEEIGNPIHDGNVGRPKDPNYKDCVYVNIKSQNKPGVLGMDKKPLLDPLNRWDTLTVEEKNNLARMMIEKIYISMEKGVDIHYYF